MSQDLSRLNVSLVADTVEYVQKLKKAEKQTKKSTTDMSKTTTKMGGAIGMAAGAAVASLVALGTAYVGMVNQSVAARREQDQLARAVNLSSRDLGNSAKMFQQAGIDASKYTDIIKDLSDKVGDFAITSGGPLVDLFDALKGKSDLTLSELQKLSGEDGLIRVKQAMDDANLSMKDQIFLMESISGDASKLIPILGQGADEIARQREEYEKLNATLSSTTTQSMTLAQDGFSSLWNNISVFVTEGTAGLSQIDGILKSINETITGKTNEFKNENLLADPTGSYDSVRETFTGTAAVDDYKRELDEATEYAIKKRAELVERINSGAPKGYLLVEDVKLLDKRLKQIEFIQKNLEMDRKKYADSEAVSSNLEAYRNYPNQLKKRADALKQQADFEKNLGILSADTKRRLADQEILEQARVLDEMKISNEEKLLLTEQFMANQQAIYDKYNALDVFGNAPKKDNSSGIGLPTDTNSNSNTNTDSTRSFELGSDMNPLLDSEYADYILQKNEQELVWNQELLDLKQAQNTAYYQKLLATDGLSYEQRLALATEYNQSRLDIDSMFGQRREEQTSKTEEAKNNLLKKFGLEAFNEKKIQAISEAQINLQEGLSEAWSKSFPMNLIEAGMVTANFGSIMASMAGIQFGKAHSGIDSVPGGRFDESTWLLQGGERVVKRSDNKMLTKMLSDYQTGSNSNPTSNGDVNVTYNFNQPVTSEEWLQKELVKNRSQIAGLVAKEEKVYPSRKR
ncbi:hypothetical protein [Shewanella sp. SE1]|uniref:hypothetical protein n=1 Tax=Shewanella sp. SE1 TaxID=2705014 RepID=UPI00138EF444|nr:hypothetical protein [Shewanella sp. SE1]NDO73074.1 hypothetical protein [Shewanella sp. SE1]